MQAREPECAQDEQYTMNFQRWIGCALAWIPLCPVLADNGCAQTTREIQSMHMERILLQVGGGAQVVLDVRVADDNSERAGGFQHVCPEIIDNTLILFRYPAEVRGRFHMQNVKAPLDIAFFDAEGRAISIQRMETYRNASRPLYGPDKPFQFALEARAGFFGALGINESNTRMLPR
jgi:uncharacterized membrane protein (UPF0127 family)